MSSRSGCGEIASTAAVINCPGLCALGADGAEHHVCPDLIVHERGRDGHEYNLLEVEAKYGRVTRGRRERDCSKLKGFPQRVRVPSGCLP